MIWFALVGIGLAIGDVLMKQWIVGGATYHGVSLVLYIAALSVYCASLTLFAYQLRVTPFSIATILPVLINITIVFVVGLTFFNEKLNYHHLAGVCASIVALVLFSKG